MRKNTPVKSRARYDAARSALSGVKTAHTVAKVATLKPLLGWMQRAIEADNPQDPHNLRHIRPRSQMTAQARLKIYTGGYYARLRDALASDFEATAWAVGNERWAALADEYARVHPSRHPSLNFYGKHFARFLLEHGSKNAQFLSDLARLEWAIAEVFDCHDLPPLSPDALIKQTPEQWERAILEVRPAVQIHEFTFDVNTFYQTWRDGKKPRLPRARKQTWIQVYRVGLNVTRLALPHARYVLLHALMDGRPLGKALELAEKVSKTKETTVASLIKCWFKDWASDGIFTKSG